jgi:hypothetical protein
MDLRTPRQKMLDEEKERIAMDESTEVKIDDLVLSLKRTGFDESDLRYPSIANAVILLEREVTVLSQVVQGIATYSSDTLSGRTDGPEDRKWFRDGFEEILRRCQEALDQHR